MILSNFSLAVTRKREAWPNCTGYRNTSFQICAKTCALTWVRTLFLRKFCVNKWDYFSWSNC